MHNSSHLARQSQRKHLSGLQPCWLGERALLSGAGGPVPLGVSGALGTGSRLAHQDDTSVASLDRLCFASAAPPSSCARSTQCDQKRVCCWDPRKFLVQVPGVYA